MELKNLQVGDKLTVEMVVADFGITSGDNHRAYLQFTDPNTMGHGSRICVFTNGSSIIGHTPKPVEVKVGTKFRSVPRPIGIIYTVVLVEDGYVMYKYYDDNFRLRSSVSEIEEVRRYLTQHPLTDQEQANNG